MIKAVELKKQGYTSRSIFENHGLPYKKDKSANYLTNCLKQYYTLGKEFLFKETRGRNVNGNSGRSKKE